MFPCVARAARVSYAGIVIGIAAPRHMACTAGQPAACGGGVPVRACPLRPGRNICKQGFRKQMSKEQITVKGYVTAVPRGTDARQARVAIVQDDVEYRIIPRGAGVDLDDEVSVPVEVTGLLETADEVSYLMVRGYTVLEDDSWLEEQE